MPANPVPPGGAQIPDPNRPGKDIHGRFMAGNTIWQSARDVNKEMVTEKKLALQSAVTPDMITTAILDIYTTAKKTKNEYAKQQLWTLFFGYLLGKPTGELLVQEQSVRHTITTDYTRVLQGLTTDELKAYVQLQDKLKNAIPVEAITEKKDKGTKLLETEDDRHLRPKEE
jgi:hypothetical protein